MKNICPAIQCIGFITGMSDSNTLSIIDKIMNTFCGPLELPNLIKYTKNV